MRTRNICPRARICLPVDIIPRTTAGRVRTYVCGQPELVCVSQPEDIARGKCRYVLRQHLVADIPIEIGATGCAGDPFVEWNPREDSRDREEE